MDASVSFFSEEGGDGDRGAGDDGELNGDGDVSCWEEVDGCGDVGDGDGSSFDDLVGMALICAKMSSGSGSANCGNGVSYKKIRKCLVQVCVCVSDVYVCVCATVYLQA